MQIHVTDIPTRKHSPMTGSACTHPILLALGLAAASACSTERTPSEGVPTTGGAGEDAAGSDGSGDDDSAGDADTSGGDDGGDGDGDPGDGDGDSGGGIRFDIGDSGDSAGSGGEGGDCTGDDCGCTAVDILFVVDNSGSMDAHRDPIAAAFDPFVDQMVASLQDGTSLHVGVTRATGFYDPGNGSAISGCVASYLDGTYAPPDVMQTTTNGQQGRLFDYDGRRFFEYETGLDSGALKTWFEGALGGAIQGDDHSNTETVVAGAAYPFHPVNATHNAGFMRDQAVLLLFLISDAPDLTPESVPTQDFIDMVSQAKSACGDHCILTAGTTAAGCYEGANTAQNNRLYEFMNGFGQAPAARVDLFTAGESPDFASVLGSALSDVIATTCESIPPVG